MEEAVISFSYLACIYLNDTLASKKEKYFIPSEREFFPHAILAVECLHVKFG